MNLLARHLGLLAYAAILVSHGAQAVSAEGGNTHFVTQEVVNVAWLNLVRARKPGLDLVYVPENPLRGALAYPPLLDANRDGSFSLWLSHDPLHYRIARSGSLTQLDPFVASASRLTTGGVWVCVHGNRHSELRQFKQLVGHLRDAGYSRVCIVSWRADPEY